MPTITKINLQLVSPTKYDWKDVASKITRWKFTPYEKAKAIYVWLCENISYDTTYSIRTADEAWHLHRGVCQAYCEIFYRLGSAVGLDVRIVSGYGRHSDDKFPRDKHGWIVVNKARSVSEQYRFPESITYLKGEEHKANFPVTRGLTKDTAILIDPTWGAGSVENGRFVKNDHDMSWFDVNPFWMIFTHLPDNPQDQLLNGHYISEAQFRKLPALKPSIEGYGFEAEETIHTFLKNNQLKLPKMSERFADILSFDDIPIQNTLTRGKEYRFSFHKKQHCCLAIINNNDFLIEDGNDNAWVTNRKECRIVYAPKSAGELHVGIQNPSDKNSFTMFLTYKVI